MSERRIRGRVWLLFAAAAGAFSLWYAETREPRKARAPREEPAFVSEMTNTPVRTQPYGGGPVEVVAEEPEGMPIPVPSIVPAQVEVGVPDVSTPEILGDVPDPDVASEGMVAAEDAAEDTEEPPQIAQAEPAASAAPNVPYVLPLAVVPGVPPAEQPDRAPTLGGTAISASGAGGTSVGNVAGTIVGSAGGTAVGSAGGTAVGTAGGTAVGSAGALSSPVNPFPFTPALPPPRPIPIGGTTNIVPVLTPWGWFLVQLP